VETGANECPQPSGLDAEDVDTARLVARIQAGDRDAFAMLYLRYFDRVYSYLRLVFRDAHEAEDAAQQVFVKILEGLAGFAASGRSFRGWMFVVARNHAVDQLRKSARSETADVDRILRATAAAEDRELPALDWVSDGDLQLLIERLPLSQRQVLFLRYVVGLGNRETASVLGLSPEAAQKQHARAIRFLHDRLAALGRDTARGNWVGVDNLLVKSRVLRARRFALTSRGPTG
jgi:RNA polymerase sigma-70 factor (ECF subfamily)